MINKFIFRKILLNSERQKKAFYKVFKVCFDYNKLRHTNKSYSIAEDLVLPIRYINCVVLRRIYLIALNKYID